MHTFKNIKSVNKLVTEAETNLNKYPTDINVGHYIGIIDVAHCLGFITHYDYERRKQQIPHIVQKNKS